jgi:hypothetical protein
MTNPISCGPQPGGGYKLCVPLKPGQAIIDNPVQYVDSLYLYSISIAGALAVLVLVYSGLQYILAAGSASEQGAAKSRIWRTVIGLVVLLSAVFILNVIDPRLAKLEFLNLPSLAEKIAESERKQSGRAGELQRQADGARKRRLENLQNEAKTISERVSKDPQKNSSLFRETPEFDSTNPKYSPFALREYFDRLKSEGVLNETFAVLSPDDQKRFMDGIFSPLNAGYVDPTNGNALVRDLSADQTVFSYSTASENIQQRIITALVTTDRPRLAVLFDDLDTDALHQSMLKQLKPEVRSTLYVALPTENDQHLFIRFYPVAAGTQGSELMQIYNQLKTSDPSDAQKFASILKEERSGIYDVNKNAYDLP